MGDIQALHSSACEGRCRRYDFSGCGAPLAFDHWVSFGCPYLGHLAPPPWAPGNPVCLGNGASASPEKVASFLTVQLPGPTPQAWQLVLVTGPAGDFMTGSEPYALL